MSGLGTEKGLRGPPGQEVRIDRFPHSLLIPATRASLKAQACSFLLRGSSSSLWDHPSPNGSQGVFFRPHRGFIPAQASRLENPLTPHGLHTHDLFRLHMPLMPHCELIGVHTISNRTNQGWCHPTVCKENPASLLGHSCPGGKPSICREGTSYKPRLRAVLARSFTVSRSHQGKT